MSERESTTQVGTALPELPVDRVCPACKGRGDQYHWKDETAVSGPCSQCKGSGKVRRDPPAKCPWCYANNLHAEHAASWGARYYGCTQTSAWAYPGADYPPPRGTTLPGESLPEWMMVPFGDFEGDGQCQRIPANLASVIRDMAAERGVDLMAFLMGEECPTCSQIAIDGEPIGESEKWKVSCSLCRPSGGTGRVVDRDVRRELGPYRNGGE